MNDLDNEDNLDITLTKAGFGGFNVILSVIGGFIAMATIFCTTSFSYAMTSMGCEITLTNAEKGRLNSMAYMGMISGAIFWAFISDNIGRRPVILISHVGDVIFGNVLALSQQFTILCICKFLSGLCISGGYSTFLTYLAEVTSSSRRTHMMFFFGLMLNISTGILPILAMLILPLNSKMSHSYTSWQLFFTLGTIPSLIAVFGFCFMPESPKFDLHHGNYDRANRSLRKLQYLNRVRGNEMPNITVYQEGEKKKVFDFMKGMIKSIRKRHLIAFSMLIIIEICILMCQNTIRLWQPSLVKIAQVQGTELTFCSLIEELSTQSDQKSNRNVTKDNTSKDAEVGCVVKVTASHFHGNLYIFLICLDGFIITLLVASHYDVKKMLVFAIITSTIFVCCLIIARSYFGVLSILGLYLCVEYISAMAINNIAVQYFPTVVRNTFLGLIMFSGRLGSVIGNHLLPYLIDLGCIYLFGWLLTTAFSKIN